MAQESAVAPPVYISAADVERLVSMKDLVDAITNAFAQFSAGEKGGVVQPVRTSIPIKDHDGYTKKNNIIFMTLMCTLFSLLLSMPAYSSKAGCLAVKLVSVYPGNTAKDLPSHMGVVVIFDPAIGAPIAVSIITF